MEPRDPSLLEWPPWVKAWPLVSEAAYLENIPRMRRKQRLLDQRELGVAREEAFLPGKVLG